ncbi:MAG TPA: prevent-host-death protein [Vicinamibacteria bacterium]|nr:prevent-host-death protein [Vicinamibacteria bacterium]
MATRVYHAVVRVVGVRVLAERLDEYVRLAAGGETVLVTEDDRVVAEIGPPREGRASVVADALLADAVRKGWVQPPLGAAEGPPPRAPVVRWEALSVELDRDRGDR